MSLGGLKAKRVAVGVGGGIAAYKAADLVRELRRAGAEVRVAMTDSAQKFVTPLTFMSLSGNPVLTDYFDAAQEGLFGHLQLARWADLYVVAPATADLLARLRAGMANDAVTTSLLAFRGPVLLAPSMNVAMYENRITQDNLKALAADARFAVVGPGVGLLADGDVGPGRLAEPAEILEALAKLASRGALSGAKVLVTAGPTREFLDPVRFLSNPSTGKMGLAIADAAKALGAEVTVILGPVGEAQSPGAEIVRVTSAEQMDEEVLKRISGVDYFVAAAAVSDYRPRSRASQKLKKSDSEESLVLMRTPDVLADASKKVARLGRKPMLVGFAAETERLAENAQAKLLKKGLDVIVANDVSQPDAGFAVDTNRVTVMSRHGDRKELAGTKADVARQIWDFLIAYAEGKSGSSGKVSRP
ncbi:MAG TPA: bifunctional phosphopantothenoylcysteine decarboxylase/phosphopantothenate--cysteine ligase CoaBC [Myxococcaceae bacterium]|nr:bifunctional phosphopantothenoylcysteine decarboxylase/phosphopantothenate--cysteine ligase CoaBC [Myxococcaceae bacterium]